MSFEWPIARLGDHCLKIGSGATPKGGKSVYLESGDFTLIRSQNIYNEGFKSDGLAYITPQAAEKLKNVEVQSGDVLLNITGDSVARVCLAPKNHLPARVNQHVAIIRPDPDHFDARYLRYLLAAPQQQELLLVIASAGATRNALTKGHIESLEVCKPPLKVQCVIADQIEALEVKIQLNHQINQTLEQMAQAIFKSWFVDFEPVKAKIAALDAGGTKEDALLAAMQVISGKDADQLNQMRAEQPEQHAELRATAELFPSDMQDSELGEIPDGWVQQPLGAVISLDSGFAYKGKNKGAGNNYLVTMGCVSKNTRFERKGLHRYDGEFKKANLVTSGDICVSSHDVTQAREHLGAPFIIPDDLNGLHIAAATNTFIVRRKTDFSREFLYQLFKSQRFRKEMLACAKGTAILHIGKKSILDFEYVAPSASVLTSFESLLSATVALIDANTVENEILGNLRDTLLPKLLSGELNIPQFVDETNAG